MSKKLKLYLEQSHIHINRLLDVVDSLEAIYPLDNNKLENISIEDKNKLDVLEFRFEKLQDLIGTKIFREYLIVLEYPIEDKNFLELLAQLDEEKIIDIDIWSEFGGIKNNLSHDYSFEEDEKIENINYLINNVKYLIDTVQTIEKNIETIL